MRSLVFVSYSVLSTLTLAGAAFSTSACSVDTEDFRSAATGGAPGGPDAGGLAGASQGPGSGNGGAAGSSGESPAGGAANWGSAGSAAAEAGTLSAIGQACSTGGQCQSGHCADGVCCDTACDGACTSCNQTGHEGTCTPVPVDTDPKGECGGTSCKFGIETVAACNGAGACYQLGFSCQPYTCGESGCLTACASAKDCSSTAWCNAGKCQTLKETGQTCPSADACKSGLCEQGVCCATSCAAPFSCDSGTCTCGGQICPAGDQCIAWYEDKDGDGFGNPKKHKQGCSSFAEAGWSKLGTDCFDTNANARPGQTLRFLTDRGDGSFDFDCDGVESQAYPAVINPNACKVCGACVGECAGKVGFDCNAVPYCPSANVGFSQYTACGSKGTLYECSGSEWSNTCLATFTAKPSAAQTCR